MGETASYFKAVPWFADRGPCGEFCGSLALALGVWIQTPKSWKFEGLRSSTTIDLEAVTCFKGMLRPWERNVLSRLIGDSRRALA